MTRERRFAAWWGVGTLVAVTLAALAAAEVQKNNRVRALAEALTSGDSTRAPQLIARYGCGGCHTIAGAPGADGRVGPPLAGLIDRVYIGGTALNTAENLVAWILDPRSFSPRTAMPPTGIADQEARDVAAFLYRH